MSFLMVTHVSLGSKHFIALGTFERFFFSVRTYVCFKVRFIREFFLAILAYISSLQVISLDMLFQFCLFIVRFFAVIICAPDLVILNIMLFHMLVKVLL